MKTRSESTYSLGTALTGGVQAEEFQVQPWKVREPHHPGEEVLAEEEAEDALQDEEDGVEAQGE